MRHIFIPDTQVKPGTPTEHLIAAGNYIASKRPDVIIHAGDHWDMPSLSSYEKKGSKYFEGKRIKEDIDSGNEAMHLLTKPIFDEMKRIRKNKKKAWQPRMVFTMGNHENRINRFIHENPQHEGMIGTQDLDLTGWEVYDYQVPVVINGIVYCHNFVNPDSLVGGVVTGTIENKLNKLKRSFCCGHQQRRQFGQTYDALGKELIGLVAGRFYQHEEHYLGPQKQTDWSGIVVKNQVSDGTYDPMFVGMKYLMENYL